MIDSVLDDDPGIGPTQEEGVDPQVRIAEADPGRIERGPGRGPSR